MRVLLANGNVCVVDEGTDDASKLSSSSCSFPCQKLSPDTRLLSLSLVQTPSRREREIQNVHILLRSLCC